VLKVGLLGLCGRRARSSQDSEEASRRLHRLRWFRAGLRPDQCFPWTDAAIIRSLTGPANSPKRRIAQAESFLFNDWVPVGASKAAQERVPIGGLPRLTPREAEVLQLLAVGLRTSDIARSLSVSAKDVEYHVNLLLRKFEVPNRTGLVSRAYVLHYLVTESWPPRCIPAGATPGRIASDPQSHSH
jgi:DNA-binding CsgD family transcriptional regulator